MPKRLNPARVKIHYSYKVEEAADLLGVHKNTVRQWINKEGLPVCDDRRRPILILGDELRAFIQSRQQARKRQCADGELYCMRCRRPRRPAGDMVDYFPETTATGRLEGMCPACSSIMNRFTGRAGLSRMQAILDVSIPRPLRHIGDRGTCLVNSDFE